jgi:hypothetical protein
MEDKMKGGRYNYIIQTVFEMAEHCAHISEQNYTKSLQGRKIYKDQCVRCFQDAVLPFPLRPIPTASSSASSASMASAPTTSPPTPHNTPTPSTSGSPPRPGHSSRRWRSPSWRSEWREGRWGTSSTTLSTRCGATSVLPTLLRAISCCSRR